MSRLIGYLFYLNADHIIVVIYTVYDRVEILTAILEAQKQRVSRQGIEIDKLKHQHLTGNVGRERASDCHTCTKNLKICPNCVYRFLQWPWGRGK